MTTRILIGIDQYLHRWGTPEGELWFCVRPFVTSKTALRAWAERPEAIVATDGTALLDFTFLRADMACPPDLFPVNLPSKIDIWHNIPDASGNPHWTSYAREHACSKGSTSFAAGFNGKVADYYGKQGLDGASNMLEMMFHVGSREKIADFSDRYATGGTPNPLLRLDGGSDLTSMFWMMGLMHRVGGRDAIARLRAVQSYDLVLNWGPVTMVNGLPTFDANQSRGLHLPGSEPGEGPAIERMFFHNTAEPDGRGRWLPSLPDGAMPAAIDAQFPEPVPPDHLYVKPVERNLERLPGADGVAFRIAQSDRLSARETPGAVEDREIKTAYAPDKLIALELELIDAPGDPVPDQRFDAALLVTGRLRPYRRFPMRPATAAENARIATVMAFEPDADCADDFNRFLKQPGDTLGKLKAAFNAVRFREAGADRGWWKAVPVSVARLPWDGESRLLRLLATPESGADMPPPAATGAPRALVQATLSLFVPLAAEIKLSQVRSFWVEADQRVRHTILFGTAPAGLPRFNALRLKGSDTALFTPQARLTAVFRDDYAFERGQHTLAIEGQAEYATPARQAVDAAAAPAGFAAGALSPFRTHAEEWANFNVLRQIDENGVARGFLSQDVTHEGAGCDGQLLGIRHHFPFGQSWAESARDYQVAGRTQNGPPKPDWQKVRAHVASIYRLALPKPLPGMPAAPSITLGYLHSYGEVHPLKRFTPPLNLSWPVEVATAAEIRDPDGAENRDGRPFVSVAFPLNSSSCTVHFDPAALKFAAPPAPAPGVSTAENPASTEIEQRFAAGTLAWRALAECYDDKTQVSISLRRVTYDLFGRDAKGNAIELQPDWKSALYDEDPIELANSDFDAGLKNWARSCFVEGQDLQPYSADFPVAAEKIAETNIARFDMTVKRPPARNSDAATLERIDRRLRSDSAPNSQTRKFSETLTGAWAATNPRLDADALKSAAEAWRTMRSRVVDSITPHDQPVFNAKAFADAVRGLREGSDWFPPPGAPSYKGNTVTPVLIPCGLCPVAPHADLADNTGPAIEALFAHFQDYVDIVVPGTSGTAADFTGRFSAIEDAVPRFEKLVEHLVERLLFAQSSPEPGNGVTESVRVRAQTFNPTEADKPAGTPALRGAVAALLTRHPMLFASIKAILLTELTIAGKRDLRHVAGARFQRDVKPWTDEAKDSGTATATLEVQQLIALDPLGSEHVTKGIAFVELLDDVAYDNAFLVRADGQTVEPFEAVVDPDALLGKEWTTAIPATPIESQNQSAAQSRQVPLASRRPVSPPMLRGAVVPRQTGALAANSKLVLADLLRGEATPNPKGDHLVSATASIETEALKFQDEVLRLVYVIRGDEEGGVQQSQSLFRNDIFGFASAELGSQSLSIDSDGNPAPRSANALSPLMRALSDAPRESAQAGSLIAELAKSLDVIGTTYVVRPGKPAPIGKEGLRFVPDGSGIRIAPAETWPKGLRNAALLRPVVADIGEGPPSGQPLAVMVLDMKTNVWEPAAFAVRQTRNASIDGYTFAEQFRTGASQVAPPTKHVVTKSAQNGANDWLAHPPIEILDASVTVRGLLDWLAGARMNGAETGLFDPEDARKSGLKLSVTIYEEQFLRPLRTGDRQVPAGRVLVRSGAFRMVPEDMGKSLTFPPNVRNMSIDLQWNTDSGEPVMRLERIFLKAKNA